MDSIKNLDYEIDGEQIYVIIKTNSKTHELEGFKTLMRENLWKVIESDFEDSVLFFREQPYQKLKMSNNRDSLELKLTYPDGELEDATMSVSKSRFKEFLKDINQAVGGKVS
ncbi:MAG: hypothetical protein R6V35_02425 [Candidatus Nanohaloarchaea archaeon]